MFAIKSLPLAPPHESELQGDHIEILDSTQSVLTLLRYGRATWGRLSLSIGYIGLSGIAVMIAARLLGIFVESIRDGASTERLLMLGAGVLSLEIASIAAQYFGRMGLAVATNRIVLIIRRELFAKLRRLPMSYFDRQPMGRTITRLTHDVEGIEDFFGGTLARLLTALINIGVVFFAMLLASPKFGLIVIASSLPAIVVTIISRAPVRDWLRSYKRRSAHTSAMLAEFLGGMQVIKIFGLERWSMERYRRACQDLLDAGIALLNWNSLLRPIAMLLCTAPLLVILWYGGVQVIDGALSLGMVVAFVRFSERFTQPIRVVSQEIQVIQEALTSSERLRQLLSQREESDELGEDGTLALALKGQVSFENVSMSYRKGADVLNNISFEARPGEKIALVGATGSGKTSCLSLIPRLYEFQSGRILLDGVDIRKFRRGDLRAQLGMVTQDVVIFRGTLRDNLCSGCDDWASVSDELIREACLKTGLWKVVELLPRSLDTFIHEGGENLSAGERQLVAFTRMLIRNPAILILDEATANVDEECERLVQRATHEALQSRTCFVIAHRLSTILQCDRIIVLSHGRVLEQGSHGELMASDTHYRRLVRQQLGAS